jgi:hypothetical protein
MEEPMMTKAQRDELKALCQKADVPDKSGELLTQAGRSISSTISRSSSPSESNTTRRIPSFPYFLQARG